MFRNRQAPLVLLLLVVVGLGLAGCGGGGMTINAPCRLLPLRLACIPGVSNLFIASSIPLI